MTSILGGTLFQRQIAPRARSAALAACLLLSPSVARAVTYYVDRTNPACSDTDIGTEASPFCTVGAGVLRAAPGVTVMVKPGTYREKLVIPASGASGSPFVIQADGEVVLEGADDLSAPDRWTSLAGDVWLAASVAVAPRQVFVDDVRLAASTVAPDQLPPSSFCWVAGAGLYVNAGGGSPGLRRTFVSARANAFRVTGRSWVEIRGFQISRYDDKGIYVLSGSQFVTVAGNTVTLCASNGIGLNASTDVTIEGNQVFDNGDHGISLLAGVTRSVIRGNESARNARPTVRAAAGIYLFGCSGNTLANNRLHHNQDTGLDLTNQANDNVFLQNLSYANGDHGYDQVECTGNVHVGDVAWGNYKDGFSVEGNSTGTRIWNCIAAENGPTTDEFDLYVDPGSMPGLASDWNVFWKGGVGTPIKVNLVRYASVSAFAAATGLDTHSLSADPRFENPAIGRFDLLAGSPGIDSGDSSPPFWPALDAEGRARIDAPAVANTGTGPVAYADRGALEYRPPPEPPVLTAPASATVLENNTVTVLVTTAPGASGSPVLALTADRGALPSGNNATFTTSSDRSSGTFTWRPTYADSGTYRITFLATNPETARAITTLRVTNVDRTPQVTVITQVRATPGVGLRLDVTASDPDGDPIAALTANLSRLPAGNNAAFAANADRSAGTLTWTPTSRDKGRNFRVTFTAANALSKSVDTEIRVRGSGLVSDASPSQTPESFALAGPLPNPARGEAVWNVAMPMAGILQWRIFDPQGRQVWSETMGMEAGIHTYRWKGASSDGRPLAAGVYFARVQSSFESAPRAMPFLFVR